GGVSVARGVGANHRDDKADANGRAMRNLLPLLLAVWKTGRPFDPAHYPWGGPAGGPDEATAKAADGGAGAKGQAAGHKPGSVPAAKVVTAACAGKVAQAGPQGEGTYIDFAHVKRQLPLERVLAHLGLGQRLRGSG